MRYSYKILRDYVLGEIKKEEIIEYLKILGLNPQIIKREDDDIIFEIETPANRPDLLSFLGILREIRPFGNFDLKNIDEETEETISDFLPVEIENYEDCFYYSCRIVKNIKNSLSPEEFKRMIENIGFRSSFYVVDISNFVMCEIGQPLHIFDLDKIKGKIIVRRGKKGEKIITIDGKERELEDILVISDEEKPIAIAGIMGGKNTEVTDETKNILIESAYFNPVVIRKGSKKLGLLTDASLRFEKGLNFSIAKKGMKRATYLIKKYCGGEVGKISFSGFEKEEKRKIYLKKENIERILGIDVEDGFIDEIFEKLNFKFEKKNEFYLLYVPEYRKDIKEEIDIIEEIARYRKYSTIPEEMPFVNLNPSPTSSEFEKIELIKNILVNLGFSEVINLSFISDKVAERFNIEAIKIENPLSQNFAYLRTSLIFNILDTIKYNLSHQNEEIEIFEIGKIYKKEGNSYKEENSLMIVSIDGDKFFDFKGKVEKFFERCGIEFISYKEEENSFAIKGTNSGIFFKDEKMGDLFVLSEEMKGFYDIKSDVYVCEIYMDRFLNSVNFEKKFKQLPKFPSSKRDFSFLFNEDINWGYVEKELKDMKMPVESIEVFDIYKGKGIPEGKISVSFSVVFRSPERTLENEEINFYSEKIIEMIKTKFNGIIRGKDV